MRENDINQLDEITRLLNSAGALLEEEIGRTLRKVEFGAELQDENRVRILAAKTLQRAHKMVLETMLILAQ